MPRRAAVQAYLIPACVRASAAGLRMLCSHVRPACGGTLSRVSAASLRPYLIPKSRDPQRQRPRPPPGDSPGLVLCFPNPLRICPSLWRRGISPPSQMSRLLVMSMEPCAAWRLRRFEKFFAAKDPFDVMCQCGLLKYHHPKTKKNKNKNTRKDWSLLLS